MKVRVNLTKMSRLDVSVTHTGVSYFYFVDPATTMTRFKEEVPLGIGLGVSDRGWDWPPCVRVTEVHYASIPHANKSASQLAPFWVEIR